MKITEKVEKIREKERKVRKKRKGSRRQCEMVCKRCGKQGHNSRTCSEVKRVITKKKRKYVCKLCGEEGHSKKTCRKRSRRNEEMKAELKCVLDHKEENVCILDEDERRSLKEFLKGVTWKEDMNLEDLNWEEVDDKIATQVAVI